MRARRLLAPVGLLLAALLLLAGGVAALRTANQSSDPVAAGGRPAVFVGQTDRACSSSQRYGQTGCGDMWTGEVRVGGRVVARDVPWAGSMASGRPTTVTTAGGMTQLRGVPAIWAEGFTYAYPPGYTGDGVVTSGDGLGLAIALLSAGGILLIGSIAWGVGAIRR